MGEQRGAFPRDQPLVAWASSAVLFRATSPWLHGEQRGAFPRDQPLVA
jgi:hypothetical protein